MAERTGCHACPATKCPREIAGILVAELYCDLGERHAAVFKQMTGKFRACFLKHARKSDIFIGQSPLQCSYAHADDFTDLLDLIIKYLEGCPLMEAGQFLKKRASFDSGPGVPR